MISILNIFQVIISILLITTILLQQRGGGLSPVLGGGGGSGYRTRRGLERMLFFATIILSILFLGSAFAVILIAA